MSSCTRTDSNLVYEREVWSTFLMSVGLAESHNVTAKEVTLVFTLLFCGNIFFGAQCGCLIHDSPFLKPVFYTLFCSTLIGTGDPNWFSGCYISAIPG